MLHERQSNLERRLEGTEGLSQKSGELYSRIEELQLRVGKLNGKIEELEHKIDQLQRTPPPAVAPALSEPVVPPAGNAVQESAPPAPQASVVQPPVISVPPRNTPPAPPETAPGAADRAAFERASQLQQQGKFEAARKEFQVFLSRYPKSDLADDALLGIGECYSSEKRYQDAIESYQQVMDKSPRGSKNPYCSAEAGGGFSANRRLYCGENHL